MDYSRLFFLRGTRAKGINSSKFNIGLSKEQRKAFNEDYFNRSLLPIRTSLFFALILYALFGILDYWVVPESKEITWIIRFAIVCPLLIFTYFLTYSNFFKEHTQPFLISISLVVGFGIVAMIAVANPDEPGYVHYYAGLFLVTMWNYTLLRLRFVFAVMSSLALVGGYEYVLIYEQGMLQGGIEGEGFPIFINNNFFLLSSNIIGILSGYIIEIYMKIDFLQRADLENAYNELKFRQEQLIQAEKDASLGQLVAGVAHEINTPIGIGVTAASHFVEKTEKIIVSFENRTARKDDMEEYFESAKQDGDLILKNLKRTSELIKSFKMVSADQTSGEIRKFNVKSYLEDIIHSLGPKLKKTPHEINIKCDDDYEVNSYPGAFAQVITNLIINSVTHAYPTGKKGNILILVTKNSNNVSVKYSDDGIGIPEENLKKIYDPFFTTSRGAGGTGLGLHVVSNIVTQLFKGKIKCDSTLGAGTTFTIELPINT